MPDTSLSNRRAAVTGGARGIGLAVARRLLRDAARVSVSDIDGEALEGARGDLEGEFGAQVILQRCDVGDPQSIATLRDEVVAAFGGLDILVNNAAVLDWTDIEALTPKALDEVLRVNLYGAVACIQAFLPDLSTSPHARIVNVSSINGMRGTSSSVAYNASKAALISLTRSLAVDLAPRGILVNCGATGFVETRMSKLQDGTSEYETELFKEVYIKDRKIPLVRPGRAGEVAGPVAFLCSDDARYITGHVLIVDGGVTATF